VNPQLLGGTLTTGTNATITLDGLTWNNGIISTGVGSSFVIIGSNGVINTSGGAASTGSTGGSPTLNGALSIAAGATLRVTPYAISAGTYLAFGTAGVLTNNGTMNFTPFAGGGLSYIEFSNPNAVFTGAVASGIFNNRGVINVGPQSGAGDTLGYLRVLFYPTLNNIGGSISTYANGYAQNNSSYLVVYTRPPVRPVQSVVTRLLTIR
jgi:hypothetical protein